MISINLLNLLTWLIVHLAIHGIINIIKYFDIVVDNNQYRTIFAIESVMHLLWIVFCIAYFIKLNHQILIK